MIDWNKGIAVGMPATIGVGSDSYAAEVVELVGYKTAAAKQRAGHDTKAVVVRFTTAGGNNGRTMTFRIRNTERGDYFYIPKHSAYHLHLGEAVDYMDPHF